MAILGMAYRGFLRHREALKRPMLLLKNSGNGNFGDGRESLEVVLGG